MRPRLIIHHSFGRTSHSNWYQSVAQELNDLFEIIVPDAPNTDDGKIEEWLPAFEQLQPDENTIVVGHSLGGDVILRYLEQPNHRLKAIFLVATPIDDLNWDDLRATGFFDQPFDWDMIKRNATYRVNVASRDDRTVPYAHAETMQQRLDSKLMTFEDKGHFNQETFPELVTAIKEIIL